ncbi:P-loop containing nucleoside triphosphate hydrolase protein [Heliocybe sulcata]|uniref:P-loop containing nucleoside triphosphate hydrolase protein n=1 Tax=Heliocybe sulcata TaxID=5364 RepID=A0A5C3MZG3_9AGAM|nr:P-loop containing nucleoside triphosphate hydrolase protein [Heliocybe sulcata]
MSVPVGLVPPAFVLVFLAGSIPLPRAFRRLLDAIQSHFGNFITLEEAEALASPAEGEVSGASPNIPLWRNVLLSWIALLETLVWLGISSYRFFTAPERDYLDGTEALAISCSWLYASAKPALDRTSTPCYDLLLLYSSHLMVSTFSLGKIFYDRAVHDSPFPSQSVMVFMILNLLAVITLLWVILTSPMAVPTTAAMRADIGITTSPEDYTSLWRWYTFDWIRALINRGRARTLNETDVRNLSPTMRTHALYLKFCRIQAPTLAYQLWKASSLDVLLGAVMMYAGVVCDYAGPFFLKNILAGIEDGSKQSRAQAFIFAFLAFLAYAMRVALFNHSLWYTRRASIRARSELQAAIYEKALKRKDFSGVTAKARMEPKRDGVTYEGKGDGDKSRTGADIGKVVNLMSADTEKICAVIASVGGICTAPLEIVMGSLFLYNLLGLAAFSGIVAMLLSWLLSRWITRQRSRISRGLSAAKDSRSSIVSELIGAAKLIKLFAWEDQWICRVLDARKEELAWLKNSRINGLFFRVLSICSPTLISLISFFTYVTLGNQLSVSTAFAALMLFTMIKDPLDVAPTYIMQIIDIRVALQRIEDYLNEDEVETGTSSLANAGPGDASYQGLAITNGTFKWNEVRETGDPLKHALEAVECHIADSGSSTRARMVVGRDFTLRDVDITFPEGKLTLITGPTASGKTALLMALLGEMTILSGRVSRPKSTSVDSKGFIRGISYAAQNPWLRHQSIKDNIVFGYPIDEAKYDAVIDACSLKPDFEQLEDGDATEVGARGISLSGGQKARIALARAVYAPTKYVLLDDPLSSVDSHTARQLFERLFCGPLLADRTVLLVTHHVSLILPSAAYIVRLLDGGIDIKGSVEELTANGHTDRLCGDLPETEIAATETAKDSPTSEDTDEQDIDKDIHDHSRTPNTPRKLVEDERRAAGSVKSSIYKTYFGASSYWTWSVILLLIALNQVMGVIQKIWIEIWGEAYSQSKAVSSPSIFLFRPALTISSLLPANSAALHAVTVASTHSRWPDADTHPMFYVGFYAAISLGSALLEAVFITAQIAGSLRASRLLFQQLLIAVVRATMRWYDVTPQGDVWSSTIYDHFSFKRAPVGRVINRFTKDVDAIDTSVSQSILDITIALSGFLAAVVTVTIVFPVFLFPAAVIGLVYLHLAIGYMRTGRDLRRMEATTRSPVFSGFQEILEGIVTVRAFSAERLFVQEFFASVDLTTKMWYSYWMTNRWLATNFDMLGGTAVFLTTLICLWESVSAGIAGLCITSAMTISDRMYWACRYWTALELDLNSVERLVEYLDLPQEPPAVVQSSRPPAYWPSTSASGAGIMLSIEDLTIKYAPELPPVLHGISLQLKPGERVGLVGRTGSGKSTLAMSLLRFVEPASGHIVIDGIDISTIGIHDLRSRIVSGQLLDVTHDLIVRLQTFIPQDVALFSGTLRENLDPSNTYSDHECLAVLRRMHIISDDASDAGAHSVGTESPAISTDSHTVIDSDTAVTLQTQVSAGGANFSQGQRQLVGLARAMLRRSSIVILDEATSSIDFETDAKIQRSIREEFDGALLLTVAHRLRTVIDYDRLIVLDKGRVAEFDTPYALLRKKDGIFKHMCLKSGMSAELEPMARRTADSN